MGFARAYEATIQKVLHAQRARQHMTHARATDEQKDMKSTSPLIVPHHEHSTLPLATVHNRAARPRTPQPIMLSASARIAAIEVHKPQQQTPEPGQVEILDEDNLPTAPSLRIPIVNRYLLLTGLARLRLTGSRNELLRYAATQPWGKEFHDSLPTAGVDGSLADRFKDLDTEAHVYAKTGSLGGVKTLSGYAVTAKGEQLAFSVLTNNLSVTGKRINDVIDCVVVAAANNGKK